MPRKYETEIEINGPGEAVWKALAEAEGIQSWFAPEVRVEPGVGGSLWLSWGPGAEGLCRIEVWDQNHRLRHVHDRAAGRGASIVEFTIEARDASHTTLRLVNSGFGDDAGFDDELDNTSHAWPLFLFMLKHGIENPHKTCRNLTVFRMLDLPHEQAWRQLSAGLKSDGVRRYFDELGEACYELSGMNRSLLALFCERAGEGSMLTITSLLYDTTAEQEDAVRGVVESLVDVVLANP